MSDFTRTPFLSLYKPTPDADNDAWGGHLNANADVLDSTLNGLVVGAGGPWLPTAGGTMTGPLNYTATGATTSLSAQDRWRDVNNVRDFGAVLDGTTSDQAAFTAAFGATAARGTIYVPPGNYNAGTFAPQSKPMLFQMSGNFSGAGGTIPITGIGNSLVETVLGTWTKYITRGSSIGITSMGPVMRVDMVLNHAGGSAGGIEAFHAYASTTAGATNNDYPFGVVGQCTLNMTANGGGPGCGGAFYCTRTLNAGNAEAFGANLVATDATLRSSVNAGSTVGCEIDVRANKLDDGTLADGYQLAAGPQSGSRRFMLDLKYSRADKTDNTPMEIAAGLNISLETAGELSYCTAKNGIFFGAQNISFAGVNFLHTTFGANAQAIALQNEQRISWTSAALNTVPGSWNSLQYTTTGTPRLRYMVGATERFTLPDTKPTVTGAKGSNAALASLLAALVAANLITDSTSA